MALGSEIRDPEKSYSGSRIQGSKRHRIPDPDPQHCGKDSDLGSRMEQIRIRYPGETSRIRNSGCNVCIGSLSNHSARSRPHYSA
jgi:hypothetical protein